MASRAPQLSKETRAAAIRYGPLVNDLAKQRYGISGRQLLARLVLGESGDRAGAVSSAGARGRTQFMPGSRAEAVRKFGVDPWGSADDAVHAAALHLLGKINGTAGLEGYNPGDSNYPRYILGQRPGRIADGSVRGRGGGGRARVVGGMEARAGLPETRASQVAELLSALGQPAARARPAGAGVPLPGFAAGPRSAGPGAPVSGGGPGRRESLDELIAQIDRVGQSLPGQEPAQGGQGSGSRRGARGGSGGGIRPRGKYEGTTGIVVDLARLSGLDTSSGKRSTKLTASGLPSDHWVGSEAANARDLIGTADEMRVGATRIAREIGIKKFEYGRDYNVRVNIGGRIYRIQLITSPHGTGPHVHVGAKFEGLVRRA